MKKLFLLLFLISFSNMLYSQNSSRTGLGNVALTADKKTAISGLTNIVPVTQLAIQYSDAQEVSKEYPGYHTTIFNSNNVVKESKPVIEIAAPASANVTSSGVYQKEIKFSKNNSSKSQPEMIDVTKKVTPLK